MSPLIKLAASSRLNDATHYVLCPFAGGGSSAFRHWRTLSLENEVISVMLYPGREFRIDDPTVVDIGTLAEEMIQALKTCNQRIEDTIIVGHSMGAQVAYEASKKLVNQGLFLKGLIISGCQAPHIKGRRLLGECDDKTFIHNLVEIGGCDPSLAKSPEWWPIFLPALRADFTATEEYIFTSLPNDKEVLPIPTLLISGNQDREANFSEIEEWKLWCNKVVDHLVLEGGHFYITEQPQMMLECIRALSTETTA